MKKFALSALVAAMTVAGTAQAGVTDKDIIKVYALLGIKIVKGDGNESSSTSRGYVRCSAVFSCMGSGKSGCAR